MYRRRRSWGGAGTRRTPVHQLTGTQVKRRSKCKGCGQAIEVGEPFVKLKLRKAYRKPCSACAHKPVGSKRFHPQCVPTDTNAAMGYDPNAQQAPMMHYCKSCGHSQGQSFGAFCPQCGKDPNAVPATRGGAVPPPPKPKDAKELTLEAFIALEGAFKAQLKQRQRARTPETDAEFKKLQGIKQRILRPGTDGEEQAAIIVGLQRLVKMVLA